MRIASGSLKGRLFDAPAGFKTHPMSEQIRNALFNTLGDVGGLTILDAYSGSGAVAFEAVSRGASKVYAVEKDPRTFKTLSANRDKLALGDSVEVSRANCMSWLANQELLFDVIIADPPFDQVSTAHMTTLLEYLAPNGLI